MVRVAHLPSAAEVGRMTAMSVDGMRAITSRTFQEISFEIKSGKLDFSPEFSHQIPV